MEVTMNRAYELAYSIRDYAEGYRINGISSCTLGKNVFMRNPKHLMTYVFTQIIDHKGNVIGVEVDNWKGCMSVKVPRDVANNIYKKIMSNGYVEESRNF